ncbi:MAG: hypothetical protein KGI02_08375 [Thaumarchaeota archaeon]|nr:hypothetical protein [Nitrososphaerota archaeon]MDE1840438.1 hypothetical protein [Nitrososphaerota archaeon]MDE1878146.1 hypothetical protein [Nitrososphaerota archaeon]
MITFNGYDCVIEWMSEKTVETIATIENVTKKQLIDAIKTSKNEHDLSGQKTVVSMPNVIQDNASEIVEKIDSKIPTYVQLYSDLYKKYLHIANNFYTTSCLTQKEFFGKMGVNDAILAMFNAYLGSVKQMVLFQMDMNENMVKSYVSNRLTLLDFYDQMMNRNITNFAKMFSFFNDYTK